MAPARRAERRARLAPRESDLKTLVALVLSMAVFLAHGAVAQTTQDDPGSTSSEEARPGPPPPLPDLSDPNSRTGESLGEPDARSGIPKTLRGSASKSGGPANDLNPSGTPQEAPPPKGDLANVLTGKELFHGNYCGAGQRGADLPPTDALDAACQRHDACYDAAGHRSCACDQALRREATAVSERPDVPLEVRRRSLSVAEAADAMNCRAP